MTTFGLTNKDLESHLSSLLHFCRLKTGNSFDADDLYQTVIIKFAEYLRSHPMPKNIGPYLRKMAANQLKSWHRRAAARETAANGWARTREFEPAPGQDLQQRETRRAIDAAIKSLPTAYRAVAKLHYIDGLSRRGSRA